MSDILLFNFGGMEFIIIALLVVLLFGGKKIPELMKGIGKGMKSFEQGMTEAEVEIKKAKDELDKPVEIDPKSKTEKEDNKE
ncbi:MAG: twin-arginine translocase TatA/TatE family subunit [Bacteroides sp.]